MHKKYILYILVFASISIYASDNNELSSFRIGDAFDSEVAAWYKTIVTNLVTTADALKTESDLAKVIKDIAPLNLNDLIKDKATLEIARQIDNQIRNNAEVVTAFKEAQQATKNKDSLDERIKKWTHFRKIFSHQLAADRKEAIPDYKDIRPGTNLAHLFAINEQVVFAPEQRKYYTAATIVLFSGRQHHRLVDPETDNSNLVLSRDVTASKQ